MLSGQLLKHTANYTYIETLEVYPVTHDNINELILGDVLADNNFGIKDFLSQANVCELRKHNSMPRMGMKSKQAR